MKKTAVINYLEWDSLFFGCRVGKTHVAEINQLLGSGLNDFNIIYLFSETRLNIDNDSVFFADEKLTFLTESTLHSKLSDNIYSFSHDERISPDLLNVAVSAGIFSRFNIDPFFSKNSFQKMYELWFVNSVERKLADEVYVYRINEVNVGLITLTKKDNYVSIGLVAVAEEFRGRGIGSALLNAAKYWAETVANVDSVEVITQAANQNACHLYSKNGFHISGRQYIYHLRNSSL